MTPEHAHRLRETLERNARALELRPAVGRGTAVTRIRSTEGLAVVAEEGPWRLTVDMAEKSGGAGSGPNPGVLGRSALGSCVAISFLGWAARLEVPIDSLEVEVEADYDSAAAYGLAEAHAGYSQVRVRLVVSSPAAEEDLERVMAVAERSTAYLDVFRRPHEVVCTLQTAVDRS
jgi:uncharacterized OsmC-like protein